MLRAAELQFRLAVAVNFAAASHNQPLDLPTTWTYGKHSVANYEIALTPEGASFAATLLEHSAMYFMAMQIELALIAWTSGKPTTHSDPEVRASFQISRHIRNGFAHYPLQPVWEIRNTDDRQIYSVRDIITLDATDVHGKPFKWQDFGGPLALLRLSEFVRTQILQDNGVFGSNRDASSGPLPSIEYLQQGPLTLKKLREKTNG